MALCTLCVLAVLAILARLVAQDHARLLIRHRAGVRELAASIATANRVFAQSFGRRFGGDRSGRRRAWLYWRNRVRS